MAAEVQTVNEKVDVRRQSSIIPVPSVSAFGDDDEDYKRTTREEQDAQRKAKDKYDTNFGRATFSKAPKGLEDVQNAISEIERKNSAINPDENQNGDADSSENSTDPSGEHSDDHGHVSQVAGSWQRFAHNKFQMKASHSYCCAPLQGPLLPKRDKVDHLASLASWVTILRIMGDLPDTNYGEGLTVAGMSKPVVQRVRENYNMKFSKKDIEDAHRKYTEIRVRENYNMKFSKKDVEDAHRKYTEIFKDPQSTDLKNIPFLQDNKDSMLEKVQYVTALGIYKADMRDELYCQVCKQLTNNPSRNSSIRGWVLLFLFAGSFTPSEKFAPYFLQFLKEGPVEQAQRVERLLRRTLVIGTRGQPPSWLELQAAKNCKPILIPVILMNGTRMLIQADTASTVNEMCAIISEKCGLKDRSGFSVYITLGHKGRQNQVLFGKGLSPMSTVNEMCAIISEKCGLKDRSGFSVYITLGHKIACLGHGLHRILDAISECEQHTKEQGLRESSSTWRLYFRKEFFTPWQDSSHDHTATDLAYQQVMRGVSVGEYQCEKENVLIMMAAQKYYIDFSEKVDEKQLEEFLKKWLPKEQATKHEMSFWCEKVKTEIENDFLKETPNKTSLKADIVTFAMNKWYNLFSRFYDAVKVIGPNVSWNNVIIGINCKGFNIMDESENVKVHLSYIEITSIARGRQSITVTTLQGDEYYASTSHSEDLYTLLTSFQTGLRRRSCYALTVQDAAHLESAIGFGLSKGDLVRLDKPYEDYGDSDVYSGTSIKNNKHGGIPRDVLFILATMDEPPANIMGMLTMQLRKNIPFSTPAQETTSSHQHTLQDFAKSHFRHTSETTVTKLLSKASLKKKDKGVDWKFSKEPIKKALLRRTNLRDDLRKAACRSFIVTLIYMGDAPNRERSSEIELVNEFVIDVAMRNKYLRDEIFCQVMKQLTQNPERSSEERGWQLLWLILTCTYPQTEVYHELDQFLKTSPHKFAKKCLARMQHTRSQGCRYAPPHYLEHEALIKHHSSIEFTVLFPDQSKQKIQADSSTRMSDIHRQICDKMKLRNVDEYGLFFGLKDKVIDILTSDYFFDYLSHIQRFYMTPARRESATEASQPPTPPVLIFMKKLWVNSTPGLDKQADVKFHFPQEIPNYLRGYHKCSVDDAINLGSILFRAKYGDEKQPYENLEGVLPSLIPKTVIEMRFPADWTKALKEKIDKVKFPTKEDGKVAFLKELSKWTTFGSVFFEVKQRSTKTMPKNLLVAINTNGASLIDSSTKDVLVTYSYDKIPNWAFDEYSFTFVIGEGNSVTKLYMETSVGHNMDDIVMSYITYILNTSIRKKPSYAGIVGHNMDDIVMSYITYIMNTSIRKKPSYAGIVVGESSC